LPRRPLVARTLEHPWRVSPAEARAIQERLSGRVVAAGEPTRLARVAGVDVGFEDDGKTVRAAVAVLSYPGLQPVEAAIARVPTTFPYVPGLLSFRELPGVLGALARLRALPDLVLCDGQGLAHPRRFGIACHLGVLTGLPTIGVGKTRLIGEYDEPGRHKGDWSPLRHQGETLGAVLRTREGVKPVFVSPGHKVSLAAALRLTLSCTRRYRLPETTRAAHRLASGGS
jgi:deoxyribonuclease V